VATSYASYYNRKHRRNGHLFQGRLKALLIDADGYLLPLSRYVHLNPVRAKIVAKPVEYPWSSYAAFMGRRRVPDFLETCRVLSYFGRKRREAIKPLSRTLMSSIPEFPELPYRAVIVRPYRLFYRTTDDTVWIAAVWHGAQLPDRPT